MSIAITDTEDSMVYTIRQIIEIENKAYKQGVADDRAEIIAIVEMLKDSVPVNRVLDDIVKDKPKELGMLIAYDKILKELKEKGL